MNDLDRLQARSLPATATNKMLRQTYLLLAASLIPTIIGAVVGMQFNLFANLHGFAHLAIFLVGAYGLMFAVEKNRNRSAGVYLLFAFTFFMGLMLSNLLSAVMYSSSQGAQTIGLAAGGTAVIFAGMAMIGSNSKRDFSGWGSTLGIAMLMVFLTSLAGFFFNIPALSLAISAVVMIISPLLVMYEVNRIVRGGETSYISAALALYIHAYNIFTSLLSILGIAGRD